MATERERHASSLPSTSHQNNALFLDILHEAPLFGDRKSRSIFGSVFYCFCLASSFCRVGRGSSMDFSSYTILDCAVALQLQCCSFTSHSSNGSSSFYNNEIKNQVLSSRPTECIFQQYLVYQVHKIRLQGYYSFSQKLKHIVRLPFAITAYGTAAMLLIMVWKPHIYILSISTILRIIMVIEAICAGSFMSVYIGYVHQYNSLNSQPDVLKSLYSPLQPSSSLEGLRYHEGGRLSDEQMALLQYQRENLHFLSEEILRLQECLSKYERSNDGSTPQVDLAHMLAARDQELRTLTAEVNQLQSELRLARSLIAERDSEIQSVRATNNQYVEENERLRAILGEWSTRAAKLERALEVERMSNLELQKKVSTLTNQSNTSAEPTEHRGA
uniref:FRIGIDA interacting protein 1 n=1 Tax=Quercus lobata TaxID=97700 RepID=A0A7N2MUZ0_QUELO